MASVVSLTDEAIQELMAGWQSVGLSQDQINALVVQLKTSVESQGAALTEFQEIDRPQLEADLAANSIRVAELNDNLIPNFELALQQTALELQNLSEIDVAALRRDLDSEIINGVDRPKVFVQPEAPENPDEESERYLVVGDVWFDDDDNNKQRVWNGAEWTTFAVDIPDLSLTVQKFKTNTHMIY